MDLTLIDRIRGAFAGWAGRLIPDPEKTTERSDARQGNAFGVTPVATDRLGMYREYETMMNESKLAERAVKAHADTCVSGGTVDQNFEIEVDGNARAKQVCEDAAARMGLQNSIWRYCYEFIGYGDCFTEVVCDADGPVFLKMLPRNNINIQVDRNGRIPLQGSYRQIENGVDVVKFDLWEIMHLNAGQLRSNTLTVTELDPYGARFSLLRGARRSFKQLRMVTDSLVVTRVTRAPARLKWVFDTGSLAPEQAWDYVQRRKAELKRNRFIDENGKFILEYNPLLEDDDFWIYRSETLKNTDVDSVQGDPSVNNVDDVQFLLNLYLGDLDTPKPLMGFEEGTQTRATLAGLDIQFARTVRRWQMAAAAGLKLPFYVALVLNKIDPQSVDLQLRFPPIGTADEIFIMEADKIRAEISKMLAVDLGLDIRWVLDRVFKMPDDEIDKLIATSPGPMSRPAEPATPQDIQVESLLEDFFKNQRNRELFQDAVGWRSWR